MVSAVVRRGPRSRHYVIPGAVSTMSQQALAHDRVRDLPAASKQQPTVFASRRPVSIEAGLAVVVLAALSLITLSRKIR